MDSQTSTDLAFHTSEELIRELCGRPNFLGLVVHAPVGARNTAPVPLDFDLVISATMREEDARRILQAGIEQIDQAGLDEVRPYQSPGDSGG